MKVFANGNLVEEDKAVVSISDRSFLYGDGVFETIRIFNAKPFQWEQHLARFTRGAGALGIEIPVAVGSLRDALTKLVEANGKPDSVLRITLSRGVGKRGYSPSDAGPPMLFMTLHSAPCALSEKPSQWRLITSSIRLPVNHPIAQLKTANRLLQVMARSEADRAEVEDALILNDEGIVCEASSANIFWLKSGVVCTSPADCGLLPGVTRAVVMDMVRSLDLRVQELRCGPHEVAESDGVFLTLSSLGIVEVGSLDGQRLARSPVTAQLHRDYIARLRHETA